MSFIERHEGDAYHKMFYDRQLWRLKFLGVELFKCPLDLWVYQEIIVETKPSAIVETGTHAGGSALFMATMLDLCGADPSVKVHSIDIDAGMTRPEHPRIHYVQGSSVDLGVIASLGPLGDRAMVVLDSDHHQPHVRREMEVYGALVGRGQYMIVEDSNVNGHPVLKGVYGKIGGPYEAIDNFFATSDQRTDFEIVRSCERFGVTQNPNGYLRKRQ
jgi:cephalosporin hydroxylase